MAQPIVIIADANLSEAALQECHKACAKMASQTGQEVRVLLTEWSHTDEIQATLATQGMAHVVEVIPATPAMV